jgi:hypothetical protein
MGIFFLHSKIWGLNLETKHGQGLEHFFYFLFLCNWRPALAAVLGFRLAPRPTLGFRFGAGRFAGGTKGAHTNITME